MTYHDGSSHAASNPASWTRLDCRMGTSRDGRIFSSLNHKVLLLITHKYHFLFSFNPEQRVSYPISCSASGVRRCARRECLEFELVAHFIG